MKKEHEEILHAVFSEVKTFEDLIEGYTKYYNGEIPVSPNSAGPVEEETFNQLNLIKTINQAGFLTTDSQDGITKKGIIKGIEWEIVERRYIEGIIGNEYEIVQRATVQGFMRKKLYDKLYSFIKKTDLIIFGYDILTEEFRTKLKILVTFQKSNSVETDLSHINIISYGKSLWDSITAYSPKMQEHNDIYFVTIFDPTWKRSNYMLETIHNILINKKSLKGGDMDYLDKYKKYKRKYLKLKK